MAADYALDFAWYGDDFTGAAATMEALTFGGLPSVLFLETPTAAQLARFPGLRGVGVASTSRTENPGWMRENLPDAFRALAALRPRVLHYKVCSTLDSAPHIGNIGTALEIGLGLFNNPWVPIVIAAPQMRRYQAFGHLFAGVGAAVHRLDRHPVMSRHPVTPMDEADVAAHLSRQTDVAIGCLTLEDYAAGADAALAALLRQGVRAVTLDEMDAGSEAEAGRLIWQASDHEPLFAIGSQGVEYAVIRHLVARGLHQLPPTPASRGRAATPMMVVSGSVSPITAAQIGWARGNGFTTFALDAAALCRGEDVIGPLQAQALAALRSGQDVLVHTAEGPGDPAVAALAQALAATGRDGAAFNQQIGETLGRLLADLTRAAGLQRVVISGGDTSGHATRQMGIFALEALVPTIPGASLSRAHASGDFDGLEIALKGGQMGSEDYFGWIRDGGGARG
ncbi:four-carbon acid sugar kinase family protein [Xinfangfangia sp. D13-10-4-6]|uniref:four-carbon acid sugar kinase family protein n=1 Tax=Pseudogemmobacter hezensis TaxID=2737662 RepID=UPI001553D6E7|nr:four-carbon acid sugar kinase family protein [Pseudogemmobacter hezensis]NPD16001.1 four-carbon acid sugar kinase family protein [Pseudogemmobacter hezensis]